MSLVRLSWLLVLVVVFLLEDYWLKRQPMRFGWLAVVPVGPVQRLEIPDDPEEDGPGNYRVQKRGSVRLPLPEGVTATERAILGIRGHSAALVTRVRRGSRSLVPGVVRIDARVTEGAVVLSARWGPAPLVHTLFLASYATAIASGMMPITFVSVLIMVGLVLHVVWGHYRLRILVPWAYERFAEQLLGPPRKADRRPRRRRAKG